MSDDTPGGLPPRRMVNLVIPPPPERWWSPRERWRYRIGPPWKDLVRELTLALNDATAQLAAVYYEEAPAGYDGGAAIPDEVEGLIEGEP